MLRRSLALALLLPLVGCAMLRRSDPVIDRSQDPRIRSEVEARLAREPDLASARIRVEVDGATVILHGSVNGLAAWQCAMRNAELVEGVRTVVDFLVLERGPREVGCLAPRPEPGA